MAEDKIWTDAEQATREHAREVFDQVAKRGGTIAELEAKIYPAPTLQDCCNGWRADLLDREKYVRALVTEGKVSGEAAAQAMLAVRHLEDARMRLGKVIQHSGDGVSCYDKP